MKLTTTFIYCQMVVLSPSKVFNETYSSATSYVHYMTKNNNIWEKFKT